jgi:hypothetical protein
MPERYICEAILILALALKILSEACTEKLHAMAYASVIAAVKTGQIAFVALAFDLLVENEHLMGRMLHRIYRTALAG